MELKFVVPNMAQTFGNLEFAGENEVRQQRVNDRMTVVSAVITCTLMCGVPMILWLHFRQKLEKRTFSRNRK